MRAWAGVSLIVALGSCSIPDGPREKPFPTFVATDPFPELEHERSPKASLARSSALERALAEARGDEPEVQGAASAIQSVYLGHALVGEIPSSFDEWRWAGDADTTLVLHRPPDGRPDAFVYAEAFSDLARQAPSLELLRFQLTIDPTLTFVPKFVQRVLEPLGGSAGGSTPNAANMAETLAVVATRTLGKGIGFRSDPKSFTGWKWIGHNAHRIALRLGRSAGVWSEAPKMDPHVLDLLDLEAAQKPGVDAIAQRLETEYHQQPRGDTRVPRRRSYLVIGSASDDRGHAVHLAIVCAHAAGCPVASELRGLLESLRLPSPEEAERLSTKLDGAHLAELSREAGLGLSAQPLGSVRDLLGGLLARPEPPKDETQAPQEGATDPADSGEGGGE